MKKIFFTVLLLINLILTSFSQVVNIYKLSPQQLTVNTFSVTWERASSHFSRTSLNISPFITYYDRQNKNYNSNNTERLIGAGLEVGRKFYVSKVDSSCPLKGFYVSGSISYGYFSADYKKDTNYYSNGTYYYSFSDKTHNEKIHRLGADVFIGYQVDIKKVFYIDTFLGAGMRYAISSQGDNTKYNDRFIDIGHSGIIPKAGVKLGLRF